MSFEVPSRKHRKAFFEVATVDRTRQVVENLINAAVGTTSDGRPKEPDMKAILIYLAYAIGKPDQQVNVTGAVNHEHSHAHVIQQTMRQIRDNPRAWEAMKALSDELGTRPALTQEESRPSNGNGNGNRDVGHN